MKFKQIGYVISMYFLLPAALYAQDASNMIPKQSAVKDTSRQTDLIDIAKELFKINPQKPRVQQEKKIYFSILPIPGAVPGGAGRALITSTTAGTYLGPKSTTNLSSATFAPYWNLHGRYGLPLRTSIWLKDNAWNIQGDIRFLVYPQNTWGLGSSHAYNEKTLVDNNYIRFYQSALKRIKPYFFAGLGYNLDYHSNIKSDDAAIDLRQFTGYPYGTKNSSVSSGVSLNLLYDTRNNSINPLPGSYVNVVYRVNPTFMGSGDYWNSLYVDVRKYVPLNPSNKNQQNTLAFWCYYWTVLGSNAPYLDLPSIGWDPYNRSGEGIDQNRYRGKSLFYLESEYRRDITTNGLLGFVVFANVNTVSGSGTLFKSWHPAAGTGLRIKFNKGSNTNIGIDYAASKGYNAVILNIGESF
ncbi:BamA/TamA family outer membrane protein [Mucilaginibacter panaciglaebae]|uniref:Bacterial surface antigen (D15) domain-containing protein n=1 Tax=Mucilaginibacter panaciglaebae TaxID=502331 RepID=A0ABP7WDE7_9SPHI